MFIPSFPPHIVKPPKFTSRRRGRVLRLVFASSQASSLWFVLVQGYPSVIKNFTFRFYGSVVLVVSPSVYFGGSRNPQNINHLQIAQVVGAVVAAGSRVHVGCQFGADQAVLQNLPPRSWHRVFAVHACGSVYYPFSHHISKAYRAGHHVAFCAGGQSAPLHARYLLRSIAAFQGCSVAVFFSPGAGSLAVARECVRSGLSVFAFQPTPPAAVPSVSGSWVAASFMGFACWQWVAPSQLALF